jgi:membrane protein required for colicin V production
MNMLDWILVSAAAFSALRGLIRGAVSQIFGIAGLLIGFFVATHYYGHLSAAIRQSFPAFAGASAIAFILLFILAWFCTAVLGYMVARFIRNVGMGVLDRLAGTMVGLGKAVLLAIAIVATLTMFSSHDSPLLTQSLLVPYIKEASSFLFKIAPTEVQAEFVKKQKHLEQFLSENSGFHPVIAPKPKKSGK